MEAARSRKTILLIEDSKDSQAIVKAAMAGSEICVQTADNLNDARLILADRANRKPDLLLLNSDLPDEDGLNFLKELQLENKADPLPVFLLMGRDDINAKVTAFEMDVDDCLVKPFHPKELRARVHMKLRKANSSTALQTLRKGKLILEFREMQVFFESDPNAPIELTMKELRILFLLARNERKVFSRADIVDGVWGIGLHVLDRTVDSHICSLRRKLKECSSYIESIPNQGYTFSIRY